MCSVTRDNTLRNSKVLTLNNLSPASNRGCRSVLLGLLNNLSGDMFLPGNRDWDVNNPLHDLLHNLLNRHWNLDGSDNLVGNLNSFNIWHRDIIRNVHTALHNSHHFMGNRAVNYLLDRVGNLNWSWDRDLHRSWDWDRTFNHFLDNLLDRIRNISGNHPFNWNRNLHRHFLVLWHRNLHNLFNNLLNRVWNRLVNNPLNRNWNTSLDQHFMRNWYLDNFRNCHLTGDLHHLLHNLLNWIRNVPLNNLLNWYRDLHRLDDLMRNGNITRCDDLMRDRNLDPLRNCNFIRDLYLTLYHLLNWIRNLSLNNLLNRVGDLPVNHLLHGVGHLNVLRNLNWNVNSDLAHNLTWNINRNLANNLLCHSVGFMSDNFTNNWVGNRNLLHYTPLDRDRDLNGLLHNLGDWDWDTLLNQLFHGVGDLSMLNTFNWNWNFNPLRNWHLTGHRDTSVDNALNRDRDLTLHNFFHWHNEFPLNQLNLVLTLNRNIFNMAHSFLPDDPLTSKLGISTDYRG